MTSENQTCKKSALAYDFILAPSKGDTPKKLTSSPRTPRPLSLEIIDNKLKTAEQRRHSLEMSKVSSVARHHDRVQEAARKVEELNDSFSKETEEKLQVKIVQSEERLREQRQKQMEQMQLRRNELKKAEEAREAMQATATMSIREKLDAKMETYQTNRETHINEKVGKSIEHDRHLRQTVEARKKIVEEESRRVKEKIMRGLEVALKNRNELLQERTDKSRNHLARVNEVREKVKRKSINAGEHQATVLVE